MQYYLVLLSKLRGTMRLDLPSIYSSIQASVSHRNP